jgi:hypothetical protein
MITFIGLLILIVLGITLTGFGIKKDSEPMVYGGLLLSLVIGTTLLIFSCLTISSYTESLKLNSYKQKAITSLQAVMRKNRKLARYSNKSLVAEGDFSTGKLKVNYGVPLVRHTLESDAVAATVEYNKRLASLQGRRQGWLWLSSWGISDIVDTMKPIQIRRY